MPHTDWNMVYALILTFTNTLAVGGAAWLLLFPPPPVTVRQKDLDRQTGYLGVFRRNSTPAAPTQEPAPWSPRSSGPGMNRPG